MAKVVTTIRLEEEMHAVLMQNCTHRARSMAKFVRTAIKELMIKKGMWDRVEEYRQQREVRGI